MPVSKRLRYEILRRDNHTCRYCGATAPAVPLRIDHVVPVALGGTDTADNLVTSCEPCNNGKSSSTVGADLVADVAEDAMRWAAAMQRAADNLLEQERPKQEYRQAFLAQWNAWGRGEGAARLTFPLPAGWKASIERFRTAGLPSWVWEEIVDTSMGYESVKAENKFKYCCGIAWNQIHALQAEARSHLTPASSNVTRLDTEDPEALAVEAAHLLWGQEWATVLAGPTPEQAAEFRSTAYEALASGRTPAELVQAAEYGAWFATADARQALQHLEDQRTFIDRYVAHSVFEHAWYFSHGEAPPKEVLETLWLNCTQLYEAGAHPVPVILAAAAAGLGDTTDLYVGLSAEQHEITGSHPRLLHAEDIWAHTWKKTSPDFTWPTAEERTELRAHLEQLRQSASYNTLDVYTAAAKAGLAHATALDVPHPHDAAEQPPTPVRLPPEFAPGGSLARMPADDDQAAPRLTGDGRVCAPASSD
ncbi:HNH endonuclease [Streptomyces sp. NPDC056254]|uniref:HNH endonuclease n=1 Tax=Streptomyces sp. NPDC056254 TaxID=3345763 RepID=UPI0035E0F3E9